MENKFRHELKYQISYADYLAIRSRLRAVMKPDSHTGSDGKYLIRSIYFDNFEDKALKEKLDGIRKRDKFRIRWYNDDMSFITLEKKSKVDSLCKKLDAVISKEELTAILNGRAGWMALHSEPLVRELYHKMLTERLKPRVVVSYIREPYVYEAGNVRVTFDMNIRTSHYQQDFTKEIIDLPASEEMIMEVKYDEFLPEIIQHLIQTENIRVGAFSKYSACRRYG